MWWFKRPVLVFDFDGTMVDSLDSVVRQVNSVVHRLGKKPLAEPTVERALTSGANSSLRTWPLVRFMSGIVSKLIEADQRRHMSEMEPVPGLFVVLRSLHDKGYKMGIVTSNREETVRKYLVDQGVRDLFSFIYAGAGLYGKDRLMRTMMVEQHLKPKQIIYIGDEPRDILTAHAVGVKSMAVTWGFQPRSALERVQPTWLIDSPEGLSQLVKHRFLGISWSGREG